MKMDGGSENMVWIRDNSPGEMVKLLWPEGCLNNDFGWEHGIWNFSRMGGRVVSQSGIWG